MGPEAGNNFRSNGSAKPFRHLAHSIFMNWAP